ncbi:MAG: sulfate ABC transporter permease subunit [Myxococcales bacterium]|nr:sulfate ABC transporter permease subunit [Myxococcales bacterium]
MQPAESTTTRPIELAVPADRAEAAKKAASHGSGVFRAFLLGVVFLYLGVVLVAPLVALAMETVDVGFAEIVRALGTPTALSALWNSVALVALAVAINAVVGTLGAIYIVRHRHFARGYLDALCDLPLAVSPVMIGLAFILLLGRDGVLAPVLDAAGVKILFSFPALLLATLFVTLPFAMREVAYVLEEIGTSEEEAAVTLGASPLQTFFRVTLPNIRVALSYGLMMTAARALGEFGAVLVLGGSIAGHTQTATTFIHDAIEERDLASAYGMAAVLALASIALLLVLEVLKRRTHAVTRREK